METGYNDMNNTPICAGDLMTVHEHSNSCCQHMVECRVEWDNDIKAWALKRAGLIVSGMGIAAGYRVRKATGNSAETLLEPA